jgi:hypothetical protein
VTRSNVPDLLSVRGCVFEMTDQAALKKKVALILNQCRKDAVLYGYRSSTTSGINIDFTQEPRVAEDDVLGFIELKNEQVKLLKALLQAQDDGSRHVVIDEVVRVLLAPACSAQVFVFLARYYSFPEAIKLVASNLRFGNAEILLVALAHLLHSDHTFLTDADLDTVGAELAEALNRELENLPKGKTVEHTIPAPIGSPSYKGPPLTRKVTQYSEAEAATRRHYENVSQITGYVRAQAQRIQYLRLKKELTESANFEINQDRDRLLESLASLGFSNKLTEFLKFAEGEFAKAQGIFNYKTCIDQIRCFFAELLTETAEKVATGRGETLAKAGVDPKFPVQVRDYLKNTGFFSEQFELVVRGLYRFMSDEGTHTLGATRDVARIARNIAVEIGLLITKRVLQESTSTKSREAVLAKGKK